MIVKICGIKTLEAAMVAASAGTDFIGFIFAKEQSKDDLDTAASHCEELPLISKRLAIFRIKVNQKSKK